MEEWKGKCPKCEIGEIEAIKEEPYESYYSCLSRAKFRCECGNEFWIKQVEVLE
jgi:hypothetical protein